MIVALSPLLLCALVLAAAPAAAEGTAAQAAADRSEFSKVGFYPLWENTGTMLGHRHALIGTGYFELGLGDRAQVGVRPQQFLFRTPNVHGKLQLLDRGDLEWSIHAEVLALLAGATSVFTSTNFVSRIDNTRGALWLVPVGTSLSWFPADFAAIHTTLSVMSVGGTGQPWYASLGLSSVVELRALRRHGLLLHLAEIGFWRHDLFLVGVSYRLNLAWFATQVGYFYRLSRDGSQASPLLSLGVAL